MSAIAEDGELASLLEAIFATYGYDLRRYAPASLGRRIRRAAAKLGLADAKELEARLLGDPILFSSFLDLITVHVSEMFRDPGFFKEFRAQVIPRLRTHPLPKIWHAGCAGGEEVYATAIVLSEEGVYERTQIYATDVSAAMIQHAKAGIYPKMHAEKFSENHRLAGGREPFSKYYRELDGKIGVDGSLKRNILFFQHDLIADHTFGEMHVVLCRNVLIYFEKSSRHAILRKLVESLCPGGFLCLGSSERVREEAEDLEVSELGSHGIYRRAPGGGQP